ncbi:MAG TPA: hypothetical protein DD379_05950 [Cyanobacteria bacterium UBA11162]|nr:hypothetical protein [Cyanobacteria bacterium UBA11162]
MCIAGSLTDFSLPEICRLLTQGHHTGLLTLHTDSSSQPTKSNVDYIWVHQGHIVAITNRLEGQGLAKLLIKNHWIDECQLTKLVKLCPRNQPLGLWLKQKGILTANQLKFLFQVQALQPIYALFQVQAGYFKFEHNVPIPITELTGLRLSLTISTLMGLRTLPNWGALADKLPASNSGLVSIISGQPPYRLDPLEWQIWEYTKGTVSLLAIAKQLRLPLTQVRQIAFRLIAVGLAEEVPLMADSPRTQTVDPLPKLLGKEAEKRHLSHSFLQNLAGFLAAKSKKTVEQLG